MPLVCAAIAPHGGDIVREVATDPAVMAKTRKAMEELGRRFAAARPQTIVVLTPHGIVVEDAISIGGTRAAAGSLGTSPRQISASFETDLEMVGAIFDQAQQVPLARLTGEKGKRAILPLDWGALIPLYYTTHPLKPRPQVVVLAPDRSLPREILVRCGVAIARAADLSRKRVALIASCDQAHAHDAEGPYGFDPSAAAHDAAMVAAIQADDLPRLLNWEPEFLESAKVDAYWQTLILMGALGHTPMRPALLSYEAPTYFGMMVVAFEPVRVGINDDINLRKPKG